MPIEQKTSSCATRHGRGLHDISLQQVDNYVARVEWSFKARSPENLRPAGMVLVSRKCNIPGAVSKVEQWTRSWHDFSTLSLSTNLDISTNARKLRIWKIAWAGINDKLSPTARLMYIDWRTALEAMTTNENSQIHALPKEYPTSVNNASVSRATHRH